MGLCRDTRIAKLTINGDISLERQERIKEKEKKDEVKIQQDTTNTNKKDVTKKSKFDISG